jgi:hypothetical protein
MNATIEQLNLASLLSESHMACIEIGLAEIESAASHEASQIHASEIMDATAKALRNRPEHVADILLVSSWMLAEALCTDAQRDLVRQHYLTIAQLTEDSLS